MIKIDISTAVSVYLLFSVIIILLIWIFYEQRWKMNRVSSDKRYIWQCSICYYPYVDSTHDNYSTCPQCGSFNERKVQDNDLKQENAA